MGLLRGEKKIIFGCLSFYLRFSERELGKGAREEGTFFSFQYANIPRLSSSTLENAKISIELCVCVTETV
jgi:hypothetical protein